MENNQDKNNKSDAVIREEAILEFWSKNKIFQKTLSASEKRKEFIFYEGPPTANARPALHHLEARAFKDVIPRYKTMQGFHVRRKAGWDTHGLPVELQIEKKLGFQSKKEIEEYGIAKFNKECKESVWEYLDVWNKFTKRIGYWVDQENPYVTYENDYIESVWNVIKKVDDQKLLYKDYKVVPWCPRCGTVLSSHELAQGYEDVKDLSAYVKFKIKGQENTYLLAWTTTPWTLPGNVALAIGENVDYVKIKTGNEIYILAQEKLSIVAEAYEILEKLKGKDLIGLEYEPLYPYFANTISESEKYKLEKAFKVYPADFVNTEDGTGIVHTAVMYGQDDFVLGTRAGLPKHHLIDLEGKFMRGTGFLEGRFVREADENGKPTLAVDIIEDLKKRNLFFKQENYKHSYPHCWRCHTALIYYARDSWYIRMSDPKIKRRLIDENKEINWEPSHIREGRFGEWLNDIKDWAISRERYWGTPLPVWICESCKKVDVVGSFESLKTRTKKSGNKYFVMRHGQADNNTLGVASCSKDFQHHLTEEGKKQIKNALKEIKDIKFDFIFSSPLLRTIETAQIIKNELKINLPIITDDRISEFQAGEFDGKSINDWNAFFPNRLEEFVIRPKNGENLNDLKKRVAEFIYELEKKHQNKSILIISHGDPIWMMNAMSSGMTPKEALEFYKKNFLKTGEIREIDFTPIPHNENYELDLHRPYIDEVALVCAHSKSLGQACGGDLTRTKEVMDVWFDSGAMPFAQDHYPFDPEGKQPVRQLAGGASYGAGNKKSQKILYPADFICEAIDQTRGWFYTLHAVGVLMGRGKAYKNVICLGHLLDASGKKMSKSLGNIIDPWIMIEKYGADTLRLWMYSVNQPGESKNFDEKTVALIYSQVFGLLYNVLTFYGLYRDENLEKNDRIRSKNILDKWILARLDELIKLSTENLDNYKLLEGTRGIRDFIGDLSTWYLRRSRERIKDGDKDAKRTLYFVLKTVAKIMAPFAPFTAEDIWLRLRNVKDAESVHLTKWPKMPKKLFGIFGGGENKILENMQTVRKIVTLGLEARQKASIKVRQPLAQLEFGDFDLGKEYIELVKDELNVKEVKQNKNLEGNVKIDTEITLELKQEGNYRELARALQDMRKKLELTPSDVISFSFQTNDEGKKLIQKFEADIKKTVLASRLEFNNNDGIEIKIDGLTFKVKIEK